MKVIVAKDAGYCFGVREAVSIAYESAKKYGHVYMLGDIVHNEYVVNDLEKAGVIIVDNLDDIPDDKPVLFRAHGTVTELWTTAKDEKINIIDATCPLVTDIHQEFKKLEEDGRVPIIIGDHGHDEVIGIASQVKNPIIISNVDEAKSLKKMKRAGVVSQSTQMIENVQKIISILLTKVVDLNFVNTICYPTRRNHEQIKSLASLADVIIIIGSFTSANSKRLTQLARERNESAYQVTCADEIIPTWFSKDDITVGITAGASTPDRIIDKVIQRVKEIGQVKQKEIIYE